MAGARYCRLLSAGLASFALSAMASVQAQMPPQPPASGMPAGHVLAPSSAGTVNQPSPGTYPLLDPQTPAAIQGNGLGSRSQPAPMPASSTPGCSCGERHGMSRWWWHKTQCKRHLQEMFLGFPEEFNEWPLGSSLYAYGRTQVANGNAAQMVFYHYDFVEGMPQLNDRGRDKLARLAPLLPATFCPVVIERTPSAPVLDEQRRADLVAELSNSRFSIPLERVVIGKPIAAGLAGYEAIYVYSNQLGALQSGGTGGVGGYSGTAGMDAGGMSGSANAGGGGGMGR